MDASVEPAVVFGSLAQLCVPVLSDGCRIDVAESDRAPYRVENQDARQLSIAGLTRSVVVKFKGSAQTTSSYLGRATFVWNTRTPTVHDRTVAGLLVDRAISLITQQRLQERIDIAQAVNSQLRSALQTNQRIAIAIGILMSHDAVSEDVAWEILRTGSQNSHHKLSDIADNIVRGGCTDDSCGLVDTQRAHEGT